MIKLNIDNIPIIVADGTTVLQAANANGIEIPAMCYREGHHCHPSCMVCMVQDADSGRFFTSCAMPVSEGMNIIASSDVVADLRREALELLLSDHVGDCEAPCTLSCPAGMNIPLMNRLIAGGDFDKALSVVREDIAIPLTLGYICPAPCEKACRRKPIDGAVSICLLKRFTAVDVAERNDPQIPITAKTNKRIAIIGSGPAGLSAAFYLLKDGHACTLFDKNELPGGAMRYSIPEEELPRKMLDADINTIRRMGATFMLNTTVSKDFFENTIMPGYDAVVLASGSLGQEAMEIFGVLADEDGKISNNKTFKTSRKGVFACGNILGEQKMAVRAAAQGKMAAIQLGIYLGQKKLVPSLHFNSSFGKLSKAEESEYLKESIPEARISPPGGFIAGYEATQAMKEAKRCLHCDCRKPNTCLLRIYADQYSANRRKHLRVERKQLSKSLQHDLIVYEPEKCIRCGLCVEISGREESLGLTFVGRGFDVRIGIPFSETMNEALKTTATACVTACPTGALAFKDQEERKGYL